MYIVENLSQRKDKKEKKKKDTQLVDNGWKLVISVRRGGGGGEKQPRVPKMAPGSLCGKLDARVLSTPLPVRPPTQFK